MVRLSKIIISLLLVFSFQAEAKNPPPGTGTSNIPANILIMLDNSGSMSTKLYASVLINYPIDTATDSSGNVYAMEYHNNRIKVFNSSGAYLRSFGSYGSGCSQWKNARQFTIANNKIYIADTYGKRIVILNLNGTCSRVAATNYNYPHAITANSNSLYVGYAHLYGGHSYITYHHPTYGYTCSNLSMSPQMLYFPWGMSFNSAGTKIIVADFQYNKLVELSAFGGSCSGGGIGYSKNSASTSNPYARGSYSSSNGYFRNPIDAGYDSSGNIYATDYYNNRIQKFNSSFVYQAKVGRRSTTSGFREPYGMHIDSNDKIYVADYYNQAVRQYDTSLSETATYGGGSGTRLSAAKKSN